MEKRIKAGFLAILALALAVSFAGTLYRAVFPHTTRFSTKTAAPRPCPRLISHLSGTAPI